MNTAVFVNESLAKGLRKRIARESCSDVVDILQRGAEVIRRGPQRNGPVFRRLTEHFESNLSDYTIARRFVSGTKRRTDFVAELLIPEDCEAPDQGGFAVHRLCVRRKAPSRPVIEALDVRVSKHAVERVLERKNDASCDFIEIVRELSPTLEILTHWSDERLIRRPGTWRLPTQSGLGFVASDGRRAIISINTWVHESQLQGDQAEAREKILDRLRVYNSASDTRTMKVVCGPDTPCIQAPREVS